VNIGIFGGSFDPIHHGHLAIARDALETLDLHEVRFVVARISPHKLGRRPASPESRLAMVRMAVEGEPGLVADDRELRRPPPSYTIDTLRETFAVMPDAKLFLLLGADNIPEFHTWKNYREILESARLVVFGRGLETDIEDRYKCLHLERRIDLSSTEVRTRVASGRSIRYFVPDAVRKHIADHQLYRAEPLLT